jgi:hypothetical protein
MMLPPRDSAQFAAFSQIVTNHRLKVLETPARWCGENVQLNRAELSNLRCHRSRAT